MIFNILIFVCGLFLLLVFLEFLLRSYYNYFGKIYVWEPLQKIKLIIDRTALPQFSPVSYLNINSFGELGDDPPRGDFWHTLVVGGSAVECYFVGTDKGFTGALQSSFNDCRKKIKTLKPVHVSSIAKSGMGADVLSDLLEKVLCRYDQLDLIVCMVGASDLLRWLGNSAPASGEKLKVSPADFLAVNQCRAYSLRSLKTTALYEFLKCLKRYFWRRETIVQGVGSNLHALRLMRAQAKEIRSSIGDSKLFLEQYGKNLTATLLECQKKSKRVIVILQPWFNRCVTEIEGRQFWNAAQGRPHREKVETYYSLDVLAEGMEMIGVATKDVAKKLNIEIIELENKIPSDFDHFYDFFHFTDVGVKKLSDIVRRSVLTNEED